MGQIKETFKELKQETNKTVQHETNTTAVIIGVVGVAALLINVLNKIQRHVYIFVKTRIKQAVNSTLHSNLSFLLTTSNWAKYSL